MSSPASPGHVYVKVDKLQIIANRKNAQNLTKWLTEVEEAGFNQESPGKDWKAKYHQLEQEHAKMINTTKWLRERIKELEQAAVQPRDSEINLSKKLKHSRKVIRDLLTERGDLSPRITGQFVSQEDIDAALHDDGVVYPKAPSTPNSFSTVRQSPPAVPTLPSTPVVSSRSIPSPFDPNRMVSTSNTASKRGMAPNWNEPEGGGPSSTAIEQQPLPPSPTSFRSSRPSPTHSTSTINSEEDLTIHYELPSSHQVVKGPHSNEKLHEILELTISDADALSMIMSKKGLGMKVHITQSARGDMMAFLYSPVFLEGSRRGQVDCKAIEWGHPEDTERVRNYIRQKITTRRNIIHTFTCPTTYKGKRMIRGWYYVGAMEWKVDDKIAFEPPLGERGKIVRELYHRSKKLYSKEELNDMMERQEIKGFGVALKKIENLGVCNEFLLRHGELNNISPVTQAS